MKKNLLLLFVAFLAFNFVACSDDDDDKKQTITIAGNGFNIDETFNITSKNNNASVIVNIAAENGISNLLVKIESPALPEAVLNTIGLSGEFDLANPSTDLKKALIQIGLLKEDSSIRNSKSTVFDVSQFMPLLGGFDKKGPHKFQLTVKDTAGNELKKTLTVYFPNLKN